MIHRLNHRNPILACVIKQYGSDLYRACVSLNKDHTVFLSAHPDEAGANETIHQFQEACRDGAIKTAEDVLSFAGSLDCAKGGKTNPFSSEEELSLAA
jgi:hypothetical protein